MLPLDYMARCGDAEWYSNHPGDGEMVPVSRERSVMQLGPLSKAAPFSHLWLRHEYKSNERRAPITPQQVGLLVQLGHKVTVESSPNRVFRDTEYRAQGAEIANCGGWINAPMNAFILGIKEELQEELNLENLALKHRHIYFAHVFKGQTRTPETMRRFTLGRGTLLDLEYLVDDEGKRVASFSYSAGFAGAIGAVYIWADKELGKEPPYSLPTHYVSRAELIEEIKIKLSRLKRIPRALVIGANGRSGRGAGDLLAAVGAQTTKWGRRETLSGGPFSEILQYDILCNCVYLEQPVAPFLTREMVTGPGVGSRLSVVADVSNELSYNPIFGVSSSTKFKDATLRVGNVDVIEIENLPALTPLDSSLEYAEQLFPHLLELLNGQIARNSIWEKASVAYFQHHDIPQLGMECGQELGEIYLAGESSFRAETVRGYFLEIFAKNPLTRTDRLYFVDYVIAGAAEVLPTAKQETFADLLAKAELGELYRSPRISRHHALLKAINDFTRSPAFELVTAAGAREEFYDMCDRLAAMIDQEGDGEGDCVKAKNALCQRLGQPGSADPHLVRFFDAVDNSVKVTFKSV